MGVGFIGKVKICAENLFFWAGKVFGNVKRGIMKAEKSSSGFKVNM